MTLFSNCNRTNTRKLFRTPEEMEAEWDTEHQVYIITPQIAKEKLGIDIPVQMKLYPLPEGITPANREKIIQVVKASLVTQKAGYENVKALKAFRDAQDDYMKATNTQLNESVAGLASMDLVDRKEKDEDPLVEAMDLTSLENTSENNVDATLEAMEDALGVSMEKEQTYQFADQKQSQVQKASNIFNASVGSS